MPINNFLLPGAKFTPAYEVANSCRFQDSDSSEMNRSIGSTGSNTTWTVSAWVKRVELGQSSPIFGTGDGGANNDARMVFFDADDKIECSYYNSGFTYEVTTNRLFRDISAWYHVCILFDTTESTAADRVKIYVNGTKETSFATSSYPSEDASFNFGNTSYSHFVNDMGGRNIRGSHYIAELVYLDGTALAVTNFGEFDSDSPRIWKPKDVSGLSSSKGVNGFYMDFEDSSNLGNDVWGGTDFTESNLDAQNQTTDTCTNNFATLNPLFNSAITYSEGNLHYKNTHGSNSEQANPTIQEVSNGRWYWEIKMASTNNDSAYEYFGNGYAYVKSNDDIHPSGTTTVSNGDIFGFYLNYEDGQITIHRNGSQIYQSSSGVSLSTTTALVAGFNNTEYQLNFGNPIHSISSGNADANGYGNFEYSPVLSSVNFYSLCTKNLAEFG